jgi:hypothetical protein
MVSIWSAHNFFRGLATMLILIALSICGRRLSSRGSALRR